MNVFASLFVQQPQYFVSSGLVEQNYVSHEEIAMVMEGHV